MAVAELDAFALAVALDLPVQRDSDLVERRGAVFSRDGADRYVLTRVWDDRLPILVWVMLNPSTADAMSDDQTIGRCRDFALAWGYGGIVVVNLYARRSTKPEVLWPLGDAAIGEHNAAFLAYYTSAGVTGGRPVVCAWGANGYKRGRGAAVARELAAAGVALECLKVTATGQPWHPSRLPTEIEPFPLDVVGIGAEQVVTSEYPYVWAWDAVPSPTRKGQRCRVVVRGKSMNSALVEFEDGERFVTSRNGLRRWRGAE